MTLADGVRYAPTLTSMSCPGWPIGTFAMPPGASDEQCAAVITCVGVTSEPVHWNARSIRTCATYGYSPGEAGAPPTTAWAGALTPSTMASVRRSGRNGLMPAPTMRDRRTGGIPDVRSLWTSDKSAGLADAAWCSPRESAARDASGALLRLVRSESELGVGANARFAHRTGSEGRGRFLERQRTWVASR